MTLYMQKNIVATLKMQVEWQLYFFEINCLFSIDNCKFVLYNPHILK